MKRGVFITGTDTGVGKTHVTALLLAELRRRGHPAAAFKPIACGPGGRHDAVIYRRIMGHRVPLDLLNPIYLRHPLAPSVAARLEHRTIHLRPVFTAYRSLITDYSPLLVEGAGGLLVPIKKLSFRACEGAESDDTPHAVSRRQSQTSSPNEFRDSSQARNDKENRWYLIADLARDLDLPLIIVARLGLGTINHTLLTVRQARACGLKIAGLILNDIEGGRHGLAEKTNVHVLPELCGVPWLGVVPHGQRSAALAARKIVARLFFPKKDPFEPGGGPRELVER